MPILDRYILRSFLTPFLLCFFGFFSIWLVFDLQSHTSDFLDARVSVGEMVIYYLMLAPQFMMLCLPVGLLLALLFCLSKMSRSNEIISMLTAGQSLPRVLLPLFIAGMVLTGVCTVLNYSLAPHAERIRKERKQSATPRANVFFPNRADQRFWYVVGMPLKIDTGDSFLHGVYILEKNAAGTIIAKWEAATARYVSATQTWLLFNGWARQFAPDRTLISSKPFKTLQLKGWSETPWRMASSSLDPQGMSVPELRNFLRLNADFSSAQLARYRTHLQYRWALPFQCLAVVFFAGPLAVVFSRRGMLSGIAVAIFLFAGMMFFGHLMLAIGKGGRVAPFTAAWLPIILFAGIGLCLLYFKTTNREFPKLFTKKPHHGQRLGN